MATKETKAETTEHQPTALKIAMRQFQLRQQIEETKRTMRDQAAAHREQLRRLEDDLSKADMEWASPMVQQELF